MRGIGHIMVAIAMLVATAALAAAPAGAVLVDAGGGGGWGSAATTPLPEGQLGLTGDSALTRVAAPDPEGLTGDSALTRVRGPVVASQQDDGQRWTWLEVGFGAGVLALAMLGALSLTVRQRGGRVALP